MEAKGNEGRQVLTNSIKLRSIPNWSKDLAVHSHLLLAHIVHQLISRLQWSSKTQSSGQMQELRPWQPPDSAYTDVVVLTRCFWRQASQLRSNTCCKRALQQGNMPGSHATCLETHVGAYQDIDAALTVSTVTTLNNPKQYTTTSQDKVHNRNSGHSIAKKGPTCTKPGCTSTSEITN